MVFVKRTLLFMLVLCTLGYGSAWAYDGHAVDFSDANQQTITASSSETGAYSNTLSAIDSLYSLITDLAIDSHDHKSQNSHQQSEVDCDHCGHISAHLQVVFTRNSSLSSVNQSSELLEYSEDSTSFIVSPDRRPPRV
jgi:hypothetical protein